MTPKDANWEIIKQPTPPKVTSYSRSKPKWWFRIICAVGAINFSSFLYFDNFIHSYPWENKLPNGYCPNWTKERNSLSLLLLQSLLSTRLPPSTLTEWGVLTSRLPTVRDTFTVCLSPFTNRGIYLPGPLSLPILSHRLSTHQAPQQSTYLGTSALQMTQPSTFLAHRLSTFQSTLPVFHTLARRRSTFSAPSTYSDTYTYLVPRPSAFPSTAKTFCSLECHGLCVRKCVSKKTCPDRGIFYKAKLNMWKWKVQLCFYKEVEPQTLSQSLTPQPTPMYQTCYCERRFPTKTNLYKGSSIAYILWASGESLEIAWSILQLKAFHEKMWKVCFWENLERPLILRKLKASLMNWQNLGKVWWK